MKKHFLSLVLVFGLAFVLVGCGKTEKPAPATTKAPVATTQAPVVTTEPGTTARPTTAAPTTTEHLVHSFGDEYEHDENLHWKECSICHDPSAKEPHEFVDETVTKATDTVEGVVRHTCSVCGYVLNETVDPLGHNWVFQYTVPVTCEISGYDVYKCSECGVEDYFNFVEAPGHDWYYYMGDFDDVYHYYHCI